MILDDIVVRRKEQLEREISNISREIMKDKALNTEFPAISFKNAIKKDNLLELKKEFIDNYTKKI